jgi:hypothetical protein
VYGPSEVQGIGLLDDEGHRITFASKFEIEQATVESQSRFDVSNLENNMIETDYSRLVAST